jgi:DNA-binding HxlR family transcriptional regulator
VGDPEASQPDAGADQTSAAGEAPCSIARALELIGDRWTILILRDAFRGLHRFDDLQRDLEIPRAVLAERLKRLVEHGVLERRQYRDHPPRFEYRLTPMGVELSPILVALMRWGDRHLAGAAGPPTVLVHDACGHELDQSFVCWSCDQTFAPTHIRSRPGPGRRPAATPTADPSPAGGTRARAGHHAAS